MNSCQVGLLAAPRPYVVPIGEDPAAHGHWCAFTDLYPYHTIPYPVLVQQRAAPTLICASKSQVRKYMSADRDVLPEHSPPPTPPCGGATVFTKVGHVYSMFGSDQRLVLTIIKYTLHIYKGESRNLCALGCGRALLWKALPVARRALGARLKDPTPELDKQFGRLVGDWWDFPKGKTRSVEPAFIYSSAIVNSCQSLKKVISFTYHKGLDNTYLLSCTILCSNRV